MSTITGIIVLLVIGFIKLKKVADELNKEAAAAQQTGEVVQPFESYEEDEVDAGLQEQLQTTEKSKPSAYVKTTGGNVSHSSATQRRSATAHKSSVIPQVGDKKTVPKGNRERISLRNTSEAKKAFIYSEIFNRKY